MMRALILAAFVCFLSLFISTSRAATPEQIDQAIKRARAFLLQQQRDGNWEISPKRENMDPGRVAGSQWGGLSAIATYALLAGGESPQDEKMKAALDFLRKADIVGTYALGMRAQIWPLIPSTKENRQAAQRDMETLRRAMKLEGDARGMYGYFPEGAGGFYDHSASQFAALGMWGCLQAGVEVPDQYWKVVDDTWRRHQYENGAWSYRYKAEGKDGESTISMTAAGVATLFITQEFLQPSAGIGCTGNTRDAQIDKGMQWLGDQLGPQIESVMKHHWGYYTLYGLSRIGVAGGYKYFGTTNWFELGADHLVRNQAPDGSWNNGLEGGPVNSTAFAILFLSRGRAPVLFNKLQYEVHDGKQAKAGNWNQRPRDIANLVRWLGKQSERDLNWQIVNLGVPLDELFDARILYISGDQALSFNDEQKAKLRQYVEDGGLILGHANCSNTGFAASFRKLGTELFPSYEFRELPADHLIYTGQLFPRSKWKTPPNVLGLSNGARELMLLMPAGDAGKNWQQQNHAVKPELHQLAMNIVQYVSDQQDLGFKGATHIMRYDPNVKTERTTKVARLQYAGNWNPEPGGWRRLAAITHNWFRSDLDVASVMLGEGKLSNDFKSAHLTGTTKLELNDAQKQELRKFVDAGGTLIVDACGGNTEFAGSAETLLRSIFPEHADQLKEPIAPDHAHFNVRAQKNAEVGYRRTAVKNGVGKMKHPRLRGMQINDRIMVFFSPEDISVGLVGQSIDGINGYDPKSATDCMASMVLYAGSR